MKKLVGLGVALVMVMFLAIGCATDGVPVQIQIDEEDKGVIAGIAARHLGSELEKRYPDVASRVLVLSEDIIASEEGKIITAAINSIVAILTDEFIDDPVLAADVKDLVGLLKIKPDVPITEEQEVIIKAAAQGLINGIELRKEMSE